MEVPINSNNSLRLEYARLNRAYRCFAFLGLVTLPLGPAAYYRRACRRASAASAFHAAPRKIISAEMFIHTNNPITAANPP